MRLLSFLAYFDKPEFRVYDSKGNGSFELSTRIEYLRLGKNTKQSKNKDFYKSCYKLFSLIEFCKVDVLGSICANISRFIITNYDKLKRFCDNSDCIEVSMVARESGNNFIRSFIELIDKLVDIHFDWEDKEYVPKMYAELSFVLSQCEYISEEV